VTLATSAPRLTLLGKPGCHLCEDMLEIVARVAGEHAVAERNIEEDDDLLRLYVFEIPVLLLDGSVEVARHRVAEGDLRARLTELGVL